MGKDSFYNRVIKRILDIVFSISFIVFFWWIYVILAILVAINMGSPILFAQDRPGMIDPKTGKEKIFRLRKFRSMKELYDENGNPLPDKKRLGKFGRILRATSLDELPEIFNILFGDMSFVGPRPWLVKYLEYYNESDRKRQYVKPGLTGLSQVSGRNTASWEKRFELDAYYAENVSFLLDVKILFLTVKKVFVHEGIEFNEGHQSIMEYFESHNKEGKKS